jgi:hypothetical protein
MDNGYKLTKVPLLCDNKSAIRMADNPVEHSRTKHIAIRYHFLRITNKRGISRLHIPLIISLSCAMTNVFSSIFHAKS